MTSADRPVLFTAEQAAAYLSISKRQIYMLAFPNGPIPIYKLGPRLTRFSIADLDAYAKSCRRGPSSIAEVRVVIRPKKLVVRDPNESELEAFFRKHKLDRKKGKA